MPQDISPDVLRQLLRYEPETGKLFWLNRPLDAFGGDARVWRMWNKRFAGAEAFTADHGDGYRNGRIFSGHYRAHRVIWAMHTGEWPSEQIDHINGDRSDNRIANLRSVTVAENNKNRKSCKGSSSKYVGVYANKTGKFQAEICRNGVRVYLGTFLTEDDAARAVKEEIQRQGCSFSRVS